MCEYQFHFATWVNWLELRKALIERTCLVTLLNRQNAFTGNWIVGEWFQGIAHTNLDFWLWAHSSKSEFSISISSRQGHLPCIWAVFCWSTLRRFSKRHRTLGQWLEIKRLYEYMILIIYVSILCLVAIREYMHRIPYQLVIQLTCVMLWSHCSHHRMYCSIESSGVSFTYESSWTCYIARIRIRRKWRISYADWMLLAIGVVQEACCV